jgi:hypothetical protein
MAGNAMAGRHVPRMDKDEWLTPPEIIRSLGTFDLDPCAPINRPWPTATRHFTLLDNGLLQNWSGRVWLNPPYGKQTSKWLGRLVEHGDGIALIYARTETDLWFRMVFGVADAVMFLKGRVWFYDSTGNRAGNNGGAPSALVAYGPRNVEALHRSKLAGFITPAKTVSDTSLV